MDFNPHQLLRRRSIENFPLSLLAYAPLDGPLAPLVEVFQDESRDEPTTWYRVESWEGKTAHLCELTEQEFHTLNVWIQDGSKTRWILPEQKQEVSMSEAIQWDKISRIQRNCLVAEYVFGWQWIPYNFHDVVSVKDQLWLLPDAESVNELVPGEWTWYEEDERGMPVGNRLIPYWVPHYSTSLDAAWEIIKQVGNRYQEDTSETHWKQLVAMYEELGEKFSSCAGLLQLSDFTAETVCIASLRACGKEVLDKK